MKCVICEKEMGSKKENWKKMHNAEPVRDGKCCTDCNQKVVIPLRLMNKMQRMGNQNGPTRT